MATSQRTCRDLLLFRAPPPSPAARPRDTSPEPPEDDDLSRFLERSRRVPEMILPHRMEIDLGSLISRERGGSEEENLRLAARSMGCFQIINHGIEESLIHAAVGGAEGIFGMPLERKMEAARSPERKWGFEVEEEDVGESDEFFWWSDAADGMAGVLPPQCDAFSGKMEQLLMKIKKMARELELILMDSESSIKWRKEKNNINDDNMIVCLRKHRRSKEAIFNEEREGFDLNQDVLGVFLRNLGCSHALSFHVFDGASSFRVYSKQALISFRPANAAMVVTIGDQMQKKSGGIYRQVIGKAEYEYRKALQQPISIAFLHSHTTAHDQASSSCSKCEEGKEEEKTISVSKQLIMAACLLLFCNMIASFCFAADV